MIFEEVTKKNKSGPIHMATQNLWQTINKNVFSNYAGKDLKNISMWIYDRIASIKEKTDDAGDYEFSQLNSIFELVSLIAKENKVKHSEQFQSKERLHEGEDIYEKDKHSKYQEVSLIKNQTRNHLDLDLYSLVSPVLFWCDFAVEKESRINIFKPAWKALVELIKALPVDTNTELIPIILPYLEKIHAFASKSSPTLSMLKFINLILTPVNENCLSFEYAMQKTQKRLTTFLLNFILSFVRWVPHNLNEEAFKVLDLLLYSVRFSLQYIHIKAVTSALLDKYTMRSKIHKETMNYFINLLLEQDNFAEMSGYTISKANYTQCFIDVIISESACIEHFTQTANQEKVDFLEKVNLLNLLIENMDDQHTLVFDMIIKNSHLQTFL